MIFDYYNIICPKCNHRLLKTSLGKSYGSDCFLAICQCENRSGILLYIYDNHLILRGNNMFLFSFRYFDGNFHSRSININRIIYSLTNKDTLVNVFNTTTLSNICSHFLEILNKYNNNLIFI